MKQYKALRIRIYPNKKQKTQIDKNLGATRALYNMMLYERISSLNHENYLQLVNPSIVYNTEIEYMNEYEWLKEVDPIALIQCRKKLELVFANFQKSIAYTKSIDELSPPKYKKKKIHNSYKTLFSNNNIMIDYQKKVVTLPTVRNISFRDQRKHGYGEIISATVTRTSSEKYFVSILYSSTQQYVYKKNIKDPSKVIGIDMSLSKFYIDNKGTSPEFIRNIQKYQKKLTIAQRRLSRKQYQSKNWSKERKKVALIYEKIANSRSYFNQKLIYYLVNTYDAICIEKLDMKEMIQGMNIAKSINDVRYGDFVEKLKQKGREYGTHIIQVSTYYPSSKICSSCGYKNKNLELKQKEWVCSHCNTLHNRDINAANNLRNVGLKYLGLL